LVILLLLLLLLFVNLQFLHAGDVLVFEVTSKMTLNAHIFR
jgi:hypothetical protein